MGTSRTVLATPVELAAAYDALLAPSFPPDELEDRDHLVAGLRDGSARAFVRYVDDDRAAIAVTHRVERDDVELLSYLAVGQRWRGTGIGGALLDDLIDEAAGASAPRVLLAEIEQAHQPAGRTPWGDPARRYTFYARHGARVLELPYFQPALRPGFGRVRGMLLLALHVDDRLLTPDGRLRSAPLAEFLRLNLEHCEGAPPTDAEARALLDLASDPQGVRLLDMGGTAASRLPSPA